MEELWKIIDLDSKYSVSNLGNVKNNKTGRILSKRPEKKGYTRANLNGKDYKIHRLVAIAFIPNPNNLPEINHKDTNKTNNTVTNLEWCTSSFNQKHSYDSGCKTVAGEKNPRSILNEKDVLYIWENNLSVKDIVDNYKLKKGYAKRVRSKQTWKHLLQDSGSTTSRKAYTVSAVEVEASLTD